MAVNVGKVVVQSHSLTPTEELTQERDPLDASSMEKHSPSRLVSYYSKKLRCVRNPLSVVSVRKLSPKSHI